MSIAVVGSINMDVVARVARIPVPGETVLAGSSYRGGGGKGANQAIAAARAGGAQVHFVGALGDDGPASELRTALIADGITVAGIQTFTNTLSGTALISVDDDAENSIVVIAGANAGLETLSVEQRRIVAAADVVVAQLEIPVRAVLDAGAARRSGAIFILNAAPSAPLTDPSVAYRMFKSLDVLVVNEHELMDIVAGAESLVDAVDELAALVPALIVTLGESGSIVAVGTERRDVPAFSATPVDTTGAGDTFCGVLAARIDGVGRIDIESLATAARDAAAAAALSVGRAGAQTSIPTVSEVEQFIGASL